MMKLDSTLYDLPTHPIELFTSKYTNKELMMGQGAAFLEMMGIPDHIHSERAAKSIFLLLCHKKVSLRENVIRSEYSALFKGCLNKIKLPFYSIFSRTFRQARQRFFSDEIIQVLWRRFCKERTSIFAALQKTDELRSEFFRTIKFCREIVELQELSGSKILPDSVELTLINRSP